MMMKVQSALLTALLAVTAMMASAFDETTGKYNGEEDLDTHRAPRLFHPPKARKAGYTYADEILIALKAEMDMAGIAMKGTLDAKGDMEMKVTGGSGNSVKMDLAIQNVEAELASPIMSFHCDSNDPTTRSDESCSELFGVVGQSESLLMDSDGNLLEMTTPDGQVINVAAMEQTTLDSQFKQQTLSASHHFDKLQQFLKLIPDHAVRPGDTWIEDLDLERIGNFKGESTLKGYTEYQGSDCAVFYLEGNVHLDIELLALAMGMDPETLPMKTADAHVTNEIVWDVDNQIARWFTVNITTAFDIVNPLAAETGAVVHIPADLWFAVATDILERPDHEEEPAGPQGDGAYESMYSSPSGSVSEKESGKSGGGGGGVFKGIFVSLLVGVAAAGGLMMLYRKKQESWEFVRPTYEFSPVGAEPIYNSPPLV